MKLTVLNLVESTAYKFFLAAGFSLIAFNATAASDYAEKCLAKGLKGGTREFVDCYLSLRDEVEIKSPGESSLPDCPGTWAKETWSGCFGRREQTNGRVYVGEFESNYFSGWGVRYSSDGSVESSGYWKINNLQTSQLLTSKRYALHPNQVAVSQVEQPSNNTIPTLSIPVSGKRVALVIGNSNYRTRPLRNPVNDANDVSSALKSSGFQVIDLRDASLQQMRAGVRQFGDRLINNDVGLVYYSGHGVEVKGRNYFIPVNADIQREDEIADQGLDVNLVLEKMSTAGKGVNILIVDACRDDPFGRSFRSSSRGLANMDAPRGTIIAYATSPGKVAQDGDGRNSPYTKNLVRAMQQPNKPIEQVFKEVRRAVQSETKNQQTPWENTSLSGDFYFRVQK